MPIFVFLQLCSSNSLLSLAVDDGNCTYVPNGSSLYACVVHAFFPATLLRLLSCFCLRMATVCMSNYANALMSVKKIKKRRIRIVFKNHKQMLTICLSSLHNGVGQDESLVTVTTRTLLFLFFSFFLLNGHIKFIYIQIYIYMCCNKIPAIL